MKNAKPVVETTIDLASTSTYESGIAQSHAFRVTKKITDDFLKDYGLTTMHWFIVGAIFDAANGIRITDLANKVGTTIGYLTTAVNSLELRNIVIRDEHESDSRTKVLRIHPDYARTCTEIEEGLRERMRKMLYKDLTREELTVYITVLHKLTKLDTDAT